MKFVSVQERVSSVPELRVKARAGRSTWNVAVLVTLPCGVTMVIWREVASGGTIAVMRRSRLLVGALVKMADAPLKKTAVAPVKLVPGRVIFAPDTAVPGETECR